MLSLTWKDKVAGHQMPVGVEAIREEWVYWAEKIAEPFRSAYLAVASDSSITLWCDRLAEWRTEPWDNRNGRVTLAGDAAHPMTYRKLHPPPPARYDFDILGSRRNARAPPETKCYEIKTVAKAPTTPSTTPTTSAPHSTPTVRKANRCRKLWRCMKRRCRSEEERPLSLRGRIA